MKNLSTGEAHVSRQLEKFFLRKQAGQPGFSKRALARSLKLSPSFTHEILAGKKGLPAKHLERAIRVLDIDQETAAGLRRAYNLFVESGAPKRRKKAAAGELPDWSLAVSAQKEMLLNWYFLPMLELTLLPGFDGDFARRLGITLEMAAYGEKRLKELGLLEVRDGRLQKTFRHLKFVSADTKAEFRAFHRAMLGRAEKELDRAQAEDYARRLITGATVTVGSARVPQLKARLAELMTEFLEEASQDPADEVYNFSLQFVPLTRSTK